MTKERKAKNLWLSGKVVPNEMLGDFLPNISELIAIEEKKSIKRALNLGGERVQRARTEDGTITLSRLCDDCGEPRGPMWIVRPDVWEHVMGDEHEHDICVACWEARRAGRRN